ncbi:hypothetical protein I4U23_022125 [Adineta vaga]|nr:hypothetical protein I4U23_022125 [Adineta vaga]
MSTPDIPHTKFGEITFYLRYHTIKLLLEEYHAKIAKNNFNCTPLTIVGIWNYDDVIDYYYIENTDKSWFTALEITDDPNKPIVKRNLLPPMEIYDYCKECQTIEELEFIKDNSNRIMIESLIIWE